MDTNNFRVKISNIFKEFSKLKKQEIFTNDEDFQESEKCDIFKIDYHYSISNPTLQRKFSLRLQDESRSLKDNELSFYLDNEVYSIHLDKYLNVLNNKTKPTMQTMSDIEKITTDSETNFHEKVLRIFEYVYRCSN